MSGNMGFSTALTLSSEPNNLKPKVNNNENNSTEEKEETEEMCFLKVLETYNNNNKPDFTMAACNLPKTLEFKKTEDFVRQAIDTSKVTTSTPYNSLIQCLQFHDNDDTNMLYKILLALRKTVIIIATSSNLKHYAQLTHLIFKLDTFTIPAKLRTPVDMRKELFEMKSKLTKSVIKHKFASLKEEKMKELRELEKKRVFNLELHSTGSLRNAHLHLIVALVSANQGLIRPALASLLRKWVSMEYDTTKAHSIHTCIHTLLNVTPLGRSELIPIIKEVYPHSLHASKTMFFTLQCMIILSYAPTLQGPLLKIIYDRCLEWDVEIKINVNNESDKVSYILSLVCLCSIILHTQQNIGLRTTPFYFTPLKIQLDLLMQLLFQFHIQKSFTCSAEVWKVYHKYIMPIFESSIVTTHKSKFVQFMMFFLCGHYHKLRTNKTPPLDDDDKNYPADLLYRHFCSTFLRTVLDMKRSIPERRTYVFYLASFISRADYVDAKTICEILTALLNWALLYKWEDKTTSLFKQEEEHHPTRIHALFYTICQSAFYIWCFRWEEVLQYSNAAVTFYELQELQPLHNDGDAATAYPPLTDIDIQPAKWQKICDHPLNPLKFCMGNIRSKFIKLAKDLNLVPSDMLDKIEKSFIAPTSLNKKKRRRATMTSLPTTSNKRRKTMNTPIITSAIKVLQQSKLNSTSVEVLSQLRPANILNSFFPFDPFLLKQSNALYVQHFYRDWEEIPDDVDDDDNDHKIVVDGDNLETECPFPFESVVEESHIVENNEDSGNESTNALNIHSKDDGDNNSSTEKELKEKDSIDGSNISKSLFKKRRRSD